MTLAKPRLVGVELYFQDREGAKRFYAEGLGLDLSEERSGHFAHNVLLLQAARPT